MGPAISKEPKSEAQFWADFATGNVGNPADYASHPPPPATGNVQSPASGNVGNAPREAEFWANFAKGTVQPHHISHPPPPDTQAEADFWKDFATGNVQSPASQITNEEIEELLANLPQAEKNALRTYIKKSRRAGEYLDSWIEDVSDEHNLQAHEDPDFNPLEMITSPHPTKDEWRKQFECLGKRSANLQSVRRKPDTRRHCCMGMEGKIEHDNYSCRYEFSCHELRLNEESEECKDYIYDYCTVDRIFEDKCKDVCKDAWTCGRSIHTTGSGTTSSLDDQYMVLLNATPADRRRQCDADPNSEACKPTADTRKEQFCKNNTSEECACINFRPSDDEKEDYQNRSPMQYHKHVQQGNPECFADACKKPNVYHLDRFWQKDSFGSATIPNCMPIVTCDIDLGSSQFSASEQAKIIIENDCGVGSAAYANINDDVKRVINNTKTNSNNDQNDSDDSDDSGTTSNDATDVAFSGFYLILAILCIGFLAIFIIVLIKKRNRSRVY